MRCDYAAIELQRLQISNETIIAMRVNLAFLAVWGFVSAHPACQWKSVQARIDKAFGMAMTEKRVPGIAAVVLNRNGDAIVRQSWGVAKIDDPTSAPITRSTKMGIASMTKLVTATAALQLVEQGLLSLDDLAETYLPEARAVRVLDGWDANDQPIYRAPRTKLTVRHLATHTAGLPYDFLDEGIKKWNAWRRSTNSTDQLPLTYDPGEGFSYGGSIDWLGRVVEQVSGLRLDHYFTQHIFAPLGLENSGVFAPEIAAHRRHANGSITAGSIPAPLAVVPDNYTAGGGAFLTSTIDDYSDFLLTLINEGSHPQKGVSILKQETVQEYLFTDQIPLAIPNYHSPNFTLQGFPVGDWPSNNPLQSNVGVFLPGIAKGWSVGFLVNNEAVPLGRSEGSGAWAGINNLYYWVDPIAGKLGVVFTSLAPFLDPEVLALYDLLEKEAYA
jgi:methyl acetate hydrolase